MSWEDRLEFTYRDRSGWEEGPWDSEPDLVIWMDGDIPCALSRNSGGGWCGYACCFTGHPAFEKEIAADVHGGITWAGLLPMREEIEKHRLLLQIHSTKKGNEPLARLEWAWSNGFDCSHSFDMNPSRSRRSLVWDDKEEYRDLAYARAETEKIAKALREFTK